MCASTGWLMRELKYETVLLTAMSQCHLGLLSLLVGLEHHPLQAVRHSFQGAWLGGSPSPGVTSRVKKVDIQSTNRVTGCNVDL